MPFQQEMKKGININAYQDRRCLFGPLCSTNSQTTMCRLNCLWQESPKSYNLFIYQARESSLVPVGFLTAQLLQKALSMNDLLGWENERMIFLHGEINCRQAHSSSFQVSQHVPPVKQCRKAPPYFPHQNKGFINLILNY